MKTHAVNMMNEEVDPPPDLVKKVIRGRVSRNILENETVLVHSKK